MKPVNLKELSDAFQSSSEEGTCRSFVDKRDEQIYSSEARHLAIAGVYLDDMPKVVLIAGYEIRPASSDDLSGINKVYAAARDYMEHSGNPAQWSGGYPWPDLLADDIEKQQLFVISANGKLCGVFVFFVGIDPTYVDIENGAWLNDEPYGTIHRIASNGAGRGVFKACFKFCLQYTDNIRIDTHADNVKMQKTLPDNGFVKCGTIYVHDGVSDHSPRIAYQYMK